MAPTSHESEPPGISGRFILLKLADVHKGHAKVGSSCSRAGSSAGRFAAASGTVSDGTTNFTPEPASFAQLSSLKRGELDISHE